MALLRPLLALPLAFAVYAVGHWGIGATQGGLQAAMILLWAALYVGVFWVGWLAIPVLGAGASFLQPILPSRLRRPARAAFVAWLAAWVGVLLASWLLGPPPGFERVPL